MTTITDLPVLYEPGQVSRLIFNRPEKRNALDAQSWDLIDMHLQEFAQADEARVLVVTGAGGAFSAGADIRGGITGSSANVAAKLREIGAIALRLHELPKPTVAVVDGIAAGAGMSLSLLCDVVIASERAKFGAVFSKIGLVPDCGLSWVLPRLVGPHKAKELTLTARLVEAEEALALRLVNTVVPVADLDSVTAEWCRRLGRVLPVTAAETLRALDEGWTSSFESALEAEALAQERVLKAVGR